MTLDGARRKLRHREDGERRSRSASAVPAARSTPARITTSSNTAPRGRSASSRSTTSSTGTRPAPAGPFRSTMAEARIQLPEQGADHAERDLHRAAGRARADATVVQLEPGYIVFRTTGRCRSRTASPSRRAGSRAWCRAHADAEDWAAAQGRSGAAAAGIGGGLVIGFYLLAWFLVGRDPPQGHHHSAVRPAQGHVGGRRRLCRAWAWTTGRSPPPSSASASTAVSS